MTGDKELFNEIKSIDGGKVTFGNNAKGKVIGIGSIGINGTNFIKDVLLVDGLKHNLLSVSQLCDKGNKVIFTSNECLVTSIDDQSMVKRYLKEIEMSTHT